MAIVTATPLSIAFSYVKQKSNCINLPTDNFSYVRGSLKAGSLGPVWQLSEVINFRDPSDFLRSSAWAVKICLPQIYMLKP